MSSKFLLRTFSFVLMLLIERTSYTATTARQQLAAWLVAFNRNDQAQYRYFLERCFPARMGRLDQDLAFRNYTGGFDLREIVEEAPSKVTAFLQERDSDRFARVEVDVESGEPFRIVRLDTRPVEPPAKFAPQPMSDHDLILALRKRLVEWTASDKFAGSVLIAKSGETIFAQAFGMSDRQKGRPNSLTTRFRIGSMNKMFTAVARS